MGARWIDLSMQARNQIRDGKLHIENVDLEQWLERIDGVKAEAYAYEVKTSSGVKKEMIMHKYYTYAEALNIKRKLQAKGVEVRPFTYWGKSEV